jgi:plasmid stability protein
MQTRSEALNDFETAVLAALEQTPDQTVLAADLVRAFTTRASRSSCISRIEQMERRGLVRTSRYAGRILVHSPEEE